MNENIEPIDKYDYFLDENGDNLNLEIDAPIVRAIPIQKSLNWKKFNDSAKAYLSGVPIQGLDVDPNSKYSKSWAHNVNSFAKAVAENQSYTISPYKQYTATDLHELARHFNNFDLNTSKIDFGNIKPKKLVKDYVKDHPEVSEETQQELLEQFKRLKVNEQTNKRTFKTARRYAGSDQQYKEDRKFYEDLGERGALIAAAIPAGYVAAAALTGAAYTAPYWGPWVAKNIVLPYLGGKVVNGATKWITDGKYNSFGDWAYNETPLNEWTEGTWLEEPTRFATDMLNPGYWAPYNKITKWAGPRIGKFIDGIKWKAYNEAGNLVGTQIYKNPKAIKSAENILQMIPQQHQYSFAQGVIKGNKTAALNAQNSSQWFTTEGMPNPNGKYAMEIADGKAVGHAMNRARIMNLNNTSKYNQLGKQYIKNINNSPDIYYNGNNLNKRVQATLQNIYNRDRYIEQNLEYGPTMWIDNLDNNTMLINGSNVATGVTPKYGGITNGNSRPHFNNGYYVPATGDIHFKWGETILSNQHPIFFSPNSPFKELPHGKSFNITYDNLITTAPKNQFKNDHLKYILNVERTSDQIPYRFIETKYNSSLNGTTHETPFGVEVRIPKVPIENIVGHEYDPLLKTFRRHVYTTNPSHTIHVSEKPAVNTDISNTIEYDDLYKSVTRFDNFLKNTPQSLKLSDYELNNVRLFRKWLKKNSLINPDTYTDEQLAYALQNRRNKLINQSNNNFVSIVEQINSKPYIRTFRNEYPIGNVTLQDLGDEMRIGYIEKEILDQKLTTPYTVLGLDASINVANQLKKSGVRTGELLLSPQHTLKHTTPSNYNYSIPITRHGQPKMGEYKDKSNMYRDLTISEDSDLLSGSVGYITRSLSPKHRGNLEQWLNRDGVVILKGNKYYDLNNYPGYKYFSPIKVLHSYPQRPFQHNVKSTFFDPMKIKYNENGEMLIDWDNTDLFYKCGGKINKNKKDGI